MWRFKENEGEEKEEEDISMAAVGFISLASKIYIYKRGAFE